MQKGDKVTVEFFDSMTMGNRVEEGRIVEVQQTQAVVQVEQPIRKRVIVPFDSSSNESSKSCKQRSEEKPLVSATNSV